MLRVVLDTNVLVSSLTPVLVSALLREGKPAQAIQAWREQRFLLVTSPTLIPGARCSAVSMTGMQSGK
jgi:predicted nucleic acid-binding protein